MTNWFDTHVHLDAPEFMADVAAVRERAQGLGVARCVIPAVQARDFDRAKALAHQFGDAYALGIHPMYVPKALDGDLEKLDQALTENRDDARLVAVGEIGLDYFVPELCEEPLRSRQEHFYKEQLKLAKKHGLPVILHVRRSADQLLKALREVQGLGGIAHAFNGSEQQAKAFIALGFKLGFGGALTYDRATHLRELAKALPIESIVLETDSPDMPPHWMYKTAEQRALGTPQGRNEPGELPRIAEVLAELRGIPAKALAEQAKANSLKALPGLQGLE
jgi:TatD DNase family protein